jgi:hypothetical protein
MVIASVLSSAPAPASVPTVTLPAVFRGSVDASAAMVRYLSEDGSHDNQKRYMVPIVERI